MRNSLTNFFARFITAGIGDPKRQPRYSDDIQLVEEVSSGGGGGSGTAFSRFLAVAPTLMPAYGISGQPPGPNRSICELSVGPFGAWVFGVFTGTSAAFFSGSLWTEAARVPLTTETVIDPITAANASSWGDGRDATSIFTFGDNVGLPSRPAQFIEVQGKNTLGDQSGTVILPSPIYVGPGRTLLMQMFPAASIRIGFWFREPTSLP